MIGKLFVRMGAAYGHLWSSQFKTSKMLEIAKREWLKSLVGYSFERIDQAFEKCKTEFMTPPSLGQFLTCFQVVPYHQPFDGSLAITYQESEEDREKRRERGFKAIKKIKDMLKKTPNPKPKERQREKYISPEDEARALADLEAEQEKNDSP